MNKFIGLGRLTRDPEIKTTQQGTKYARYTLAIDRKKKDDGADFPSCIAFGKSAEFAEKYLKQGTKICIEGHIQTGSYEKNGQKYYTTDIIIDSQEFAESKKVSQPEDENGFVSANEKLPF